MCNPGFEIRVPSADDIRTKEQTEELLLNTEVANEVFAPVEKRIRRAEHGAQERAAQSIQQALNEISTSAFATSACSYLHILQLHFGFHTEEIPGFVDRLHLADVVKLPGLYDLKPMRPWLHKTIEISAEKTQVVVVVPDAVISVRQKSWMTLLFEALFSYLTISPSRKKIIVVALSSTEPVSRWLNNHIQTTVRHIHCSMPLPQRREVLEKILVSQRYLTFSYRSAKAILEQCQQHQFAWWFLRHVLRAIYVDHFQRLPPPLARAFFLDESLDAVWLCSHSVKFLDKLMHQDGYRVNASNLERWLTDIKRRRLYWQLAMELIELVVGPQAISRLEFDFKRVFDTFRDQIAPRALQQVLKRWYEHVRTSTMVTRKMRDELLPALLQFRRQAERPALFLSCYAWFRSRVFEWWSAFCFPFLSPLETLPTGKILVYTHGMLIGPWTGGACQDRIRRALLTPHLYGMGLINTAAEPDITLAFRLLNEGPRRGLQVKDWCNAFVAVRSYDVQDKKRKRKRKSDEQDPTMVKRFYAAANDLRFIGFVSPRISSRSSASKTQTIVRHLERLLF